MIGGTLGDPVEGVDPVLAAGTRVGDFLICGLLGEGAMGQVYLAQDITLGRRIALKLIRRSVMRRDGTARFLEEARATASFSHPHIVTLHAVGEHESTSAWRGSPEARPTPPPEHRPTWRRSAGAACLRPARSTCGRSASRSTS